MGCKGARLAENRSFTERSWQLWERDPALWGEKTEACLAAVSYVPLTPYILGLSLCVEVTCPGMRLFQRLYVRSIYERHLLESPLMQIL